MSAWVFLMLVFLSSMCFIFYNKVLKTCILTPPSEGCVCLSVFEVTAHLPPPVDIRG